MANGSDHVTFDTPRDVLRFIRTCLQNRDMDRLFAAAQNDTPEFWRERLAQDLRELEAAETLEKVFLTDESFPDDAAEYKLGGHARRTRHLHIDLVRVNGSWRLKNIWKCR